MVATAGMAAQALSTKGVVLPEQAALPEPARRHRPDHLSTQTLDRKERLPTEKSSTYSGFASKKTKLVITSYELCLLKELNSLACFQPWTTIEAYCRRRRLPNQK
jgi:hypothetical protein